MPILASTLTKARLLQANGAENTEIKEEIPSSRETDPPRPRPKHIPDAIETLCIQSIKLECTSRCSARETSSFFLLQTRITQRLLCNSSRNVPSFCCSRARRCQKTNRIPNWQMLVFFSALILSSGFALPIR